MTDADRAYARAEEIIAEAKASGAEKISFDEEACRALTKIPPQIAELTEVRSINLTDTQVADLTSLAEMTAIQTLSLRNTQVADLMPLAAMTEMLVLLLDGTQVADLTPLAAMTAMQVLTLNRTQVADLKPIAAINAIRTLLLDRTLVADLTPVAGMNAMRQLSLGGTPVDDLKPLAAMTGMQELWLNFSRVADLTPLAAMSKLASSERGFDGVNFSNTPAAAQGRLAEIAVIEDSAKRGAALLAYLNADRPPPRDREEMDGYEVRPDGVLRSKAVAPKETTDQDDLRQEVLRKTDALITAIGSSNEWAVLWDAARHYRGQVDRPVAAVKLNILYSAANTLRVTVEAEESARAQERVNDYLPPKIAAALVDLVQTHGLFFMGFPEGAAVHERMKSGLATLSDLDLPPTAAQVVQSLDGKDRVLDPEDQGALRDDLSAAQGDGPSARIGAIRLRARLWNIMGAIGRAAWRGSAWGGGVVLSADLVFWLTGNQTIIGNFLRWAQGPGAIWFEQMMRHLL